MADQTKGNHAVHTVRITPCAFTVNSSVLAFIMFYIFLHYICYILCYITLHFVTLHFLCWHSDYVDPMHSKYISHPSKLYVYKYLLCLCVSILS